MPDEYIERAGTSWPSAPVYIQSGQPPWPTEIKRIRITCNVSWRKERVLEWEWENCTGQSITEYETCASNGVWELDVSQAVWLDATFRADGRGAFPAPPPGQYDTQAQTIYYPPIGLYSLSEILYVPDVSGGTTKVIGRAQCVDVSTPPAPPQWQLQLEVLTNTFDYATEHHFIRDLALQRHWLHQAWCFSVQGDIDEAYWNCGSSRRTVGMSTTYKMPPKVPSQNDIAGGWTYVTQDSSVTVELLTS